jgi:hypothetical protein
VPRYHFCARARPIYLEELGMLLSIPMTTITHSSSKRLDRSSGPKRVATTEPSMYLFACPDRDAT